MFGSLSLFLLIAIPFAASFLALMMPHNARNREAFLAVLVGIICLAITVSYYPQLWVDGAAVAISTKEEIPWLPTIGLDFVVRFDGLSWLFCTMVFGIGALVAVYARYYMSPADPVPRFFSFFLAFMGSMAGVVLSGNILQMVFFWELTGLFSFLLIGYWHNRKDARRGAFMALTVTGSGGLLLLAGAVLLGYIVQSNDLDVILQSGDIIRSSPLYVPALLLILVGAFTKSALFPFHFWLPNAMAAPTPVSAYLHSATMVKMGIFLMIRLWSVLSGTPEWFFIVSTVGMITFLFGGYMAMFQNDLKGMLAYSTISHLGLITTLLGLNTELALVAAVFHVINHATFKASLFMAVGCIDHESGTRNILRLSGLYRFMPITAFLAAIASAAMAGVPLFNGFLSKEMFFEESVMVHSYGWASWIFPLAATLGGMFSVFYALRFICDVFFGPPSRDLPHQPHEPDKFMLLPIAALAMLCILVGVLPSEIVRTLLDLAVVSVLQERVPEYSLVIWHGFNKAFLMSLAAMLGGGALYYLLRKPIQTEQITAPPFFKRINGVKVFHWVLIKFIDTARLFQTFLVATTLQMQVFSILVVTLGVSLIVAFNSKLSFVNTIASTEFYWSFALLWLVGGVCAVSGAWQAKYHRLAALVLTSVVGLCTCITFVFFSAPDLALTQLTVEIITTVLFLLGLRWLPKRKEEREDLSLLNYLHSQLRNTKDFLISAIAGVSMMLLCYLLLIKRYPDGISNFFLTNSLSGGGGLNVVNVMLVDFRAFDTLGEVSVLICVALTVYALLRRFRPAEESELLPIQQRMLPPDLATDLINPRGAKDTAIGYLMVPAVIIRLVYPLALVVALYMFMRGHNQPGGGFVAGIVVVVAVITQYIISGTQWVEMHLKIFPRQLIVLGTVCLGITAVMPVLFGANVLKTSMFEWHWPWLGHMHLPSATFFDLGIFLIVVGSCILMLIAIAHQSIRSQRSAAL